MKEKIFNFVFKNWHWKLLALVAACLFWYAYVNIQDPVTSETINGIKVKVLNYDEFLASQYAAVLHCWPTWWSRRTGPSTSGSICTSWPRMMTG